MPHVVFPQRIQKSSSPITLLTWRQQCRYKRHYDHQRIFLLPLTPINNRSLTSLHRIFLKRTKLMHVQKDKLPFALEVLHLCHAPSSSHHDMEPSTFTTQNSRKKCTIDWPYEFSPGNASSLDYDKLDLPNFVTGFLLLIKPYDVTKKNAMLDYLELLMLRISSYLWPIMHAFHSLITKQIELCCLE